MNFVVEPQGAATSVWTYAEDDGKHILSDGNIKAEGRDITELNIEAKILIDKLNRLRRECDMAGVLRYVYVQDNPLSGPVPRWCLYRSC